MGSRRETFFPRRRLYFIVSDDFCLGPEIWLEYAQYSIGGIGQEGGIEKVRSIFERALTAVGLHVTKGTAIWEAYREFENAILETVQVMFRFFCYLRSEQLVVSVPIGFSTISASVPLLWSGVICDARSEEPQSRY